MPKPLPLLALFAVASALSAGCFQPGNEPGAGEEEGTEDELVTQFRGTRVQQLDTDQTEVDSIGYDLDLTLDDAANNESFRAKVKGTYVAMKPLTELSLDFEGNEIDAVKVSGRIAQFRRQDGKLLITLPRQVDKGRTFSSEITYHGAPAVADGADPNDFAAFGGLSVKRSNAVGKRIFSTLSWPRKARRWIPLRDHPSDGAMLGMRITAPKQYTVVANGARTQVVDKPDGTRSTQFEALTPMPAYDFHFVAYDGYRESDARSSGGIPVRTYVYEAHDAAGHRMMDDVPKAMDFYTTAFGAYRWGTLSLQEEPIFGGGMEHAGCVSMDETLFRSPVSSRHTAFHELAHHWSGNLVRIKTWNDFRLSEGFTEYLTRRFVWDHDGESEGRALWRSTLQNGLGAERQNDHALRPPGDDIDVLQIFDDISYQKGAYVLRTLEHEIGTEAFTLALRRWFDQGAFQARSTQDFAAHLQRETGKDVTAFFASFVYGKGHPEVRVTAKTQEGQQELLVEQLQDDAAFAFTLDVDVTQGATKQRVRVPLTGKTTRFPLSAASEVSKITVDPEAFMSGYVACNSATPCAGTLSCRRSARGTHSVCMP